MDDDKDSKQTMKMKLQVANTV